MSSSQLIESALRTIEIEKNSIEALAARIDKNFTKACELILKCSGRVVVTGMGKSGHIGKKIAATLASTGTPAMYVHPAEASHGDIGMITDADVVLAISNSGHTQEVTSLLPVLARKHIALISMTGNEDSELAKAATVNIDASVSEEACPLGLAPTSSTTVALVLGDALAMSVLEARGFTRDDFAMSHPGGNLGRKLLVKIKDVMHTGDDIPVVAMGTRLPDALLEMNSKGFGLTTIVDSDDKVVGVFTDGDLRRTLAADKDIKQFKIDDVMSPNFKFIDANALAAEAAQVMQESKVYVLVIKDDGDKICGIVKMHDLLRANVV